MRGERACLVVVSVLLLCTLTALTGSILFYNSPFKNKTDALGESRNLTEATTAEPVPTCPYVGPPCGQDWEHHGRKCYYFSPESDILPWNESKRMCQWLKGSLVKIESREEQEFLIGKIRNLMKNDENMFWIGLTDSETEGEWLWADGSPLNQSLVFWYGVLGNMEPDNWTKEDPEGEDCVRMGEKKIRTGLNWWYDRSCKIPHRCVCERPARISHT